MSKLTKAQRAVIDNDHVQWCGWDEKRRPVVRARYNAGFLLPFDDKAGVVREWAIQRDGQPTDISGNVT